MMYSKNNQGLSLLIVVVIIGVGALILALGASLLGLGELDNAYVVDQSYETLSIADGCADEALRKLRTDAGYTGGSLSLGDGSCIITVSGVGSNKTIGIVSTVDEYNRRVEVDVTLGASNNVSVTRFEEVES